MAPEKKNDLLAEFGARLRMLRRSSGLTQEELAEPYADDFDKNTISAKERGVGTNAPTLKFVQRYVQRCLKKRRVVTLPKDDYYLPLWEARHQHLIESLARQASAPEPSTSSVGGPDAPSAQFRPLNSWTAEEFGVQVPVTVAATAPNAAASSYLARTFDHALRQDVLRAHQVAPQCIALSGWSSVGKTRSAWAAVNAVLPAETPLARPQDAAELLDLLRQPVPAGSVVFLDDAAEHFKEPELRDAAQQLNTLLRRTEPVVVLVTIHPGTLAQLEELTGDPARDSRAKRARNLLAIIHEVDERLHDTTEARKLAWADPHLRHALEAAADTGRVIPMITGGPQLVSRLARLTPDTRAVVLGATDCRRLGHTAPLQVGLLADAAFAHLDPHGRARAQDEWLADALHAAGRKVTGQVSALSPVNFSPVYQVEGYDVSPYLVHHRARRQDPISPRVWQALHDHVADPDQLMNLGHAAQSRAAYSWSHRYFTRALLLGHPDAAGALQRLLAEVNWAKPDPTRVHTPVASSSHLGPDDFESLDAYLDELMDEIDAATQESTEPLAPLMIPGRGGDSLGLHAKHAVEILPERSDVLSKLDTGDDWQAWYTQLWNDLECWSPQPAGPLSQVLRAFPPQDLGTRLGLVWCLEHQVDADEPGNVQERKEILEQALAAGNASEEVLRRLQQLAVDTGDWAELRRITALGGAEELFTAARLYEEAGMLSEAEEYYDAMGARHGTRTALIEFWWRTGRRRRAEAALREHILAGNKHSMLRLMEMVREDGRVDEADALRRSGLEPDGSTSPWRAPVSA